MSKQIDKITQDNNYSEVDADATYGIDTVVSGWDNDYVNDSLRFNGNTYSVTYGVDINMDYGATSHP